MNERIRELVKQATTIEEHKWGVSYDNFNKEKFAELLIRECIEVIVRNEHATLNISNVTDEKAQGIQLGLEFATIDIAEHFGVEE